jgi:hypothetical protein
MSESDARYIFIESPPSRSSENTRPLEIVWAPAPHGELPIETPVFVPAAAPVRAKKLRNLKDGEKRRQKIRELMLANFTKRPAIEPYCQLMHKAHIALPPSLRRDPKGPNSYPEILKPQFGRYRKVIEAEISSIWKSLNLD